MDTKTNNQLPTIPEEIIVANAEVCDTEVSTIELPPVNTTESVSFRILFGF